MTELGSDDQFRRKGDMAATRRDARAEAWRGLLEDWRVREQLEVDDPGQDFPDPDETPPGNPPEYDPLPPEG